MSNFDAAAEIADATGSRFPGNYNRFKDGETDKQVVTRLRLKVGDMIECPDGVRRPIRRITDNGEVFVRGLSGKVNMRSLERE